MIIVFFAGLVVMASGGTLGNMCNVSYMSLFCNILGGALMCGSVLYFVREEQKKKDELKILTEKLVDKEERDNQINRLLESVKGVEIATKNGGTEILKSLNSIVVEIGVTNSKVEVLHKDNEDIIKSTNQLIKDEQKAYVVSYNLLSKIVEIKKDTENSMEVIKEVCNRIDNLNQIPGMVADSVDNLVENFRKTIEKIQIDLTHLEEDVADQEKDRTKKFNSIMSEIRDISEENNEEMAEEIKKLAKQYEQFEKMISSIVEQMSHIAEEDIKVMKGFLNG